MAPAAGRWLPACFRRQQGGARRRFPRPALRLPWSTARTHGRVGGWVAATASPPGAPCPAALPCTTRTALSRSPSPPLSTERTCSIERWQFSPPYVDRDAHAKHRFFLERLGGALTPEGIQALRPVGGPGGSQGRWGERGGEVWGSDAKRRLVGAAQKARALASLRTAPRILLLRRRAPLLASSQPSQEWQDEYEQVLAGWRALQAGLPASVRRHDGLGLVALSPPRPLLLLCLLVGHRSRRGADRAAWKLL